ncbi:MAG: ATP-binding cassette domain-containing protein [Bdellovibrionales bacterium]|nr:ATP-binding cassette domain-containing protein [Bdellovibrionales bacterium]
MISLSHVSKSFHGKRVIDDFSLEVPQRSILSLFGPNGCGKTTVLRMLAGLEKPDQGIVVRNERSAPSVAMVFQNFKDSFLPWMSVRRNILLPLVLRGVAWKAAERSLAALLELLPIQFNLERYIFELSGGQQQYAALLRAALLSPSLLLLDEPTSALDHYHRQELLGYLVELRQRLGCSIVCIVHDLEDALCSCDRIVLMNGAGSASTIAREDFSSFGSYRENAYRYSGLALPSALQPPLQLPGGFRRSLSQD